MVAYVHVFPFRPETAVDPGDHQVAVATLGFDDANVARILSMTPATAAPNITGDYDEYLKTQLDMRLLGGI